MTDTDADLLNAVAPCNNVEVLQLQIEGGSHVSWIHGSVHQPRSTLRTRTQFHERAPGPLLIIQPQKDQIMCVCRRNRPH
jgi:hypothetical protein